MEITKDKTFTAIFEANKYTVTWMNESTELEKDEDVPYGTAPNYSDGGTAAPTKAATAQYTYNFDGWSTDPNATSGTAEGSLPTVTGNVIYYAIFTEETNEYTVTWMNESTELEKDEDVPYGTAPNYSDGGTAAPTKAATAQYTYNFDGWSTDPNATSGTAEGSLPTVTDNVIYYAIFTEETNELHGDVDERIHRAGEGRGRAVRDSPELQ